MSFADAISSFITAQAAGLPGTLATFFFALMGKLPIVGKLFASVVLFWSMFLAYCALHAAQRNGKLAATPIYVRVLSYVIVGIMYVCDVVFNVILGSVIFLEFPSTKALTFTARCNTHFNDTNFRGKIAHWVCDGWLIPFEAGHCHS